MTKLFTSILTFAVLTSNAQEAIKQRSVINMQQRIALKNKGAFEKDKLNNNKSTAPIKELVGPAEKDASVTSFNAFSSSANIYGVTISSEKPLNYNDNVNVVSFIHRRSSTYVGSPVDNTGVIVAMISSNWGAGWDSTCIWADANNPGRYPQGAVYSAPGNTNVANAYVVGSGPCNVGGSWGGSWFASKKLAVPGSTLFNNVASQTPNAQQFFSTSGPFGPNVYSNDWPVYGFSSTDDGVIRSMGQLTPDPDASPINAKGAVIQKGVFNAGTFTWSTDSIVPPVLVKSDLFLQMNSYAYMAWSESGTVGYVVFIGSRTGATLSNRGWQPIVYKTTNSGGSWALLPGIDFNNAAFALVKKRLDPVNSNTTLVIPFFNPYEGLDCTVDANNKLHIASVIAATSSSDPDSLAYTNGYTTEQYTWPHTANKHPYLYDFYGDGTGAWNFMTIDSLTSEAPSSVSGNPGFTDNPWDDDAGKVTSDSRIQISRTPDGKFITYTWAESDPNFTNGGKFWNNIPNIKARMWSTDPSLPVTLSGTEINVTKPATAIPNISNQAFFHFTSPTSSSASITTAPNTVTVQVKTPITITHNVFNPTYIQNAPNTHYYSTELLTFLFSNGTGFNELQKDAVQFSLYPNPAHQNALVALDLKEAATLEISVLNYLGQVVKQKVYKAQFGKNEMDLDLLNLNSGIYFVSVKNGNLVSTKKLIVE
ncbi:MAG: T9SS type A sorting domain-containing protein [Bacteroidetes bacterium]|nr:T9SS type A sorting domain-containing protein [Bacteroidota bacterium]